MSDDDKFDVSKYTINYDVLMTSNMLAVTKLLGTRLQQNPYCTVKDFLESLSDADLDMLVEIADNGDPETNEYYGDLLLITEMLSGAEGVATRDTDHLITKINALCMFLAMEGLARKGLIDVLRENMSFGEDMQDKFIAKKKDGVNYDDFT